MDTNRFTLFANDRIAATVIVVETIESRDAGGRVQRATYEVVTSTGQRVVATDDIGVAFTRAAEKALDMAS